MLSFPCKSAPGAKHTTVALTSLINWAMLAPQMEKNASPWGKTFAIDGEGG